MRAMKMTAISGVTTTAAVEDGRINPSRRVRRSSQCVSQPSRAAYNTKGSRYGATRSHGRRRNALTGTGNSKERNRIVPHARQLATSPTTYVHTPRPLAKSMICSPSGKAVIPMGTIPASAKNALAAASRGRRQKT